MTKLLFFATLLLLSACSGSNKQVYFERQTLERISHLAKLEPVPPFFYASAPAFALSKDDSIAVTNFDNLHQVYVADYKKHYARFSDFLFDALNQRIKLDTNDQPFNLLNDQKFRIDSIISSIYNKEGIKGLISRYVLTENNSYKLKRAELSLNQVNTLSYYFFINQYFRQDDDYNPSIGFYTLSFVLEHVGEF